MQIYIVYEQSGFLVWTVVKAFKDEEKAKAYCSDQNAINKPEYDDYGYVPDGGVHHGYYSMELE